MGDLVLSITVILYFIMVAYLMGLIPRETIGNVMGFIRRKTRIRRRRAKLIIDDKLIKEFPSYKKKK